jgi:hypothetical protein
MKQLNRVISCLGRIGKYGFLPWRRWHKQKKDPLVYICLKAIYQQDWNTYRQKGLGLWQTAVKYFPKEPRPYEYMGEIALNALNNKEIGIPAYEKALGIYEAKKNYNKTASLLTILIIHIITING